ncbi:4-hydroxy-3-methylbut-2-enyl diphosphate reductase [Brucella abortus]
MHNRYVVEGLQARGAIFVEELDEIPAAHRNQPVVFSAHGVPKSVPADAEAKNLFYLDATCPLVSKVHKQAMRHQRLGRHVILIGHSGHPEVIGTMGQLPDGAVTLIETVEDAHTCHFDDEDNLGFVTQTTLSVDDTAGIIKELQARFPNLAAPAAESICYATTNRQDAVRAGGAGLRSVSDCRCTEFLQFQASGRGGGKAGARMSMLVQRAEDIEWEQIGDISVVGLSAGASAPEIIVDEIIDAFKARFDVKIELAETTVETENFLVNREIRDVELTVKDMAFVNGEHRVVGISKLMQGSKGHGRLYGY